MKETCITLFFLMIASIHHAQKREICLTKSGNSSYAILISEKAGTTEIKAAQIISHYFQEVTGINLPIENHKTPHHDYLIIREKEMQDLTSKQDAFEIKNEGKDILLIGNPNKGVLYAVYHFIENYLQCKKWAPNEPAVCPSLKEINIELPLQINESPSFNYREIHSTAINDQEYMDWHKLHYLEDLWGLWGHSYNRLVSPENFKAHPEYFAFFQGKRRPEQLCLSNEKVFEETIVSLEKLFKEHPTAKYWSISPNDDIGYCECDLCRPINEAEGGPQGPLMRFINKISERYPEKKFTTLAYGSTSRPPLQTRPRENVIIFLSNIDLFRNDPVAKEKSAAFFVDNLKGWLQKTPNVFIWDYYTQFTNYVAPFPDVLNIGENIEYYKTMNVDGVFAQLGGNHYVHQNEIKTYLLAKKLWNSSENTDQLLDDFLAGYYQKAAPRIKEYLQKMKFYLKESGRNLDIYGNPVSEYQSYLTPEIMDEMSSLFDDAEKTSGDRQIIHRIQKLRLAFDYAYLQQARFYGRDKNGIYVQNQNGKWILNKTIPKRVKTFISTAKKVGITELAESGYSLKTYETEWKKIIKTGVLDNSAIGSEVHFEHPWISDFPGKKEKTLTDGMYGFPDFSYNWLLFNLSNTITLKMDSPKRVHDISMSFLEDQRHWIFLPNNVQVSVSKDGINYQVFSPQMLNTEENYSINTQKTTFIVDDVIQYIKVSFTPLDQLPEWKSHPNKKPLVAIDEIWVN
ncbi:DUF4838 domain-containing protein [Kaistella montana]|uniref:DUF4838 domain-containing protein n=1 Tax=Kaistella montana TaxID=1849733 RepID=A0ABW5K654_9FLAO|nr:DUF4838 domain-containing protein [Kaistella montana]MCQ4034441.1 DUF4838 domain-containing protein [Kaistella montana]